VYLVALIGLFLFLGNLRRGDDGRDGPSTGTTVLGKTEIETIIDEPIKSKGNNSVTALENLVKARQLYTSRNSRRGNLYRCIQHYKLALAWGGEDGNAILSIDDDEKYIAAKEQLVEKVDAAYGRAYAFLREKDYDRAADAYDALLDIYPAAGEPAPNRDDKLFVNIQYYMGLAKMRKSP
jgi:tetratricopeptide (TPR) repeat protein